MCRSALAPESRASKSRWSASSQVRMATSFAAVKLLDPYKEAAELGKRLAEQLLERGAGELLASI